MSLWLVIPTRGLATGKTRLSSVLSEQQRIDFNTFCINGLLSAFEVIRFGSSSPSLQQCIVISPSADARALARERGARPLEDRAIGGLNAAIEHACKEARTHGALNILVLAADLPRVRHQNLEALLNAGRDNSVILIADKTGRGTNGMLIPAAVTEGFAFGEGSLERHHQHFAGAGLRVTIWRDTELALDIDTPEDLAVWKRTGSEQLPPACPSIG